MRRGDRLLVIILVVAIVASWIIARLPARGQSLLAEIKVDGKVVQTIDLAKLTEPLEFTIYSGSSNQQTNVIRAETGRIRVVAANCREQLDVRQGWITRPGQSIICLPHRLVVTIRGESGVDSIIR